MPFPPIRHVPSSASLITHAESDKSGNRPAHAGTYRIVGAFRMGVHGAAPAANQRSAPGTPLQRAQASSPRRSIERWATAGRLRPPAFLFGTSRHLNLLGMTP
jgi:hypothetical protein